MSWTCKSNRTQCSRACKNHSKGDRLNSKTIGQVSWQVQINRTFWISIGHCPEIRPHVKLCTFILHPTFVCRRKKNKAKGKIITFFCFLLLFKNIRWRAGRPWMSCLPCQSENSLKVFILHPEFFWRNFSRRKKNFGKSDHALRSSTLLSARGYRNPHLTLSENARVKIWNAALFGWPGLRAHAFRSGVDLKEPGWPSKSLGVQKHTN